MDRELLSLNHPMMRNKKNDSVYSFWNGTDVPQKRLSFLLRRAKEKQEDKGLYKKSAGSVARLHGNKLESLRHSNRDNLCEQEVHISKLLYLQERH